MAVSGLLAILDDISILMDDAAIMARTATAAKKTAGIIGDDLAVNTEAVIGIDPKRELPIIWEIAKGSALNKVILIPAALGLSAFAPVVITPLLMAGGTFLAYEAVHKTFHKKDHKDHQHHEDMIEAIQISAEALKEVERKKIKQAITTDFILSAEIIIVSLGTVESAPLFVQASVLCMIGLVTTVGVYGLVAGLVKVDDLGLKLMMREGQDSGARMSRGFGKGLVDHTPKVMKGLSVIGTAAMYLVGGGILLHGIPALHHAVEGLVAAAPALPGLKGGLTLLAEAAVGLVGGLAAAGLWHVAGGHVKKALSQARQALKAAVSR